MATDRATSQPAASAGEAGRGISRTAALHTAFEEDDQVRAALTQHLTARAETSEVISDRTAKTFKNFMPSMFTPEERDDRNYVASGKDLARTQRAVVEKGVKTLRDSAAMRTLKLRYGDELKKYVTPETNGRSASVISSST